MHLFPINTIYMSFNGEIFLLENLIIEVSKDKQNKLYVKINAELKRDTVTSTEQYNDKVISYKGITLKVKEISPLYNDGVIKSKNNMVSLKALNEESLAVVNHLESLMQKVISERIDIEKNFPELGISSDTVKVAKLESRIRCLIDNLKSEVPKNVAEELVNDKRNELGRVILEAKDGKNEEILVNSHILQEGVAERLRENPKNAKGPKGDRGEQGPKGDEGKQGPKGDEGEQGKNCDLSTIVGSLKPKFTLQKGEKLSEDIYEAKIVLNDKIIVTLPKIGYYMLDDQLVIHNYGTKREVTIPKDFHYLKVVKFGSSFSGDGYKLTFCNVLGNEFFEYKKYDPRYANVLDEYRFISLSNAQKEYNPDLSKLLTYRPLFFITEGDIELDQGRHSVNVFELTKNGKGRKMATLIDEFGYFKENGQFEYYDYHKRKEPWIYDHSTVSIEKEYKVTDADSEFYLVTEYDSVAFHTIPEL